MKKEELIKKIETQIDFEKKSESEYNIGRRDAYTNVLILFKQLEKPTIIASKNEPELPVIPQFVANRIEEYKEIQFGISLIFMTNRQIDDDVRFSKWISSEKDNCDKVARAWLDGYTITPEPKMQITIKSYDKTELEVELPESEAKKLIDQLKEVSE